MYTVYSNVGDEWKRLLESGDSEEVTKNLRALTDNGVHAAVTMSKDNVNVISLRFITKKGLQDVVHST